MTIDSKNIDQWLFNYYEGNLSPSEVKQLEVFLKKNPDYYEDAHAWKDSFVEEAVPVFNPSFLVKEIDSKSDRKRFAFAALALLLIGSFSALYLATLNNTSSSSTANNSISTDLNKTKNTSTTTNLNVNKNSTPYKTISNSNSSKSQGWKQSSTTLVDVQKNTVNRSNPINNRVINNSNRNNNNHVNNGLTQTTSTNSVTISNNPSYLAPANINAGINLVTQNSNISNNSATTSSVSTNPVNGEVLNTNTSKVAPNEFSTTNSVVVHTPINFVPEPIQLNNELIVANTQSIENINLTIDESDLNNKAAEQEVTSNFNPDKLMADKKAEELNKHSNEIAVDNKKKDIKTENGIRFGNLRNVSLLQGINAEFQNNASFISQHYRTDGHFGGNLRTITSGEQSSGFVAGYSHLIRKYRTTIHGFGRYTNTNSFTSGGVGLQAAMNLKLDRFNYLVPSVTVTFDQYLFNKTEIAGKSFFTQEITGKSNINNYMSANHVNISTGLLYHHKKYYVGIAFNGLMQPKFKYTSETNSSEQFAANNATINLIAGTDFISKKYPELSVSPQANLEMRNMEPVVTAGTVIKYKNWGAGLGISSKGALSSYFGFSHRAINLQYRYMIDKVDLAFGNLSGHYLTTHINIKGLSNKKKAILDDEK
jgi:hypothetical protein